MEEQNFVSFEIFQKANDVNGLQPHDRTRDYMTAATVDGSVIATGVDAREKKVRYSTKDAPLIRGYEFPPPKIGGYLDVFREAAGKVRDLIKPKK